MFLMFDVLVLFFILFYFYNRKWKIYDYIVAVIIVLITYQITQLDVLLYEFTASVLVFSLTGLHFTGNIHKSFRIAFSVIFSDMIALIFTPALNYENLYQFNVILSYTVIHFSIIKYFFLAVQIYIFIRIFKEDDETMYTLNMVSGIMFLVYISIFMMDHLDYIHQIDVDFYLYFVMLFFIVAFYYLSNLLMNYLYYSKKKKREAIQQEIVSKFSDMKDISHTSQMALIESIKGFLNNDDFEGLITYTNTYIYESHESTLAFKLSDVNDLYIKLLILDKIKNNPEIVFDIIVNDYEIEEVSSSEEYFLEMFGIILDNAIDAAYKSTDQIVRIVFEANKVSIQNTYGDFDLEAFKSKSSKKGHKDRINGLKLLEILQNESDIIILSKVTDMVTFEMMVI